MRCYSYIMWSHTCNQCATKTIWFLTGFILWNRPRLIYYAPPLVHILSFVSTLICTEIYFMGSYLSNQMDDWYFWIWWVYEKGEGDTGCASGWLNLCQENGKVITGTGCCVASSFPVIFSIPKSSYGHSGNCFKQEPLWRK